MITGEVVTIRDEVSGAPRTIVDPLKEEHIEKDRLLWYDGYTSIGGWSCPAIITMVDKKGKRFKVRSLDDMKEQTQWYDFSVKKDSSSSRMTMRLVTNEVVATYLGSRRKQMITSLGYAQDEVAAQKKRLKHFDSVQKTLKL